MQAELTTFFIPKREHKRQTITEPTVSAVVPTYKPGAAALSLVENLLEYHPKLSVVVVDDSTPLEHQESKVVLERLRAMGGRVVVLRTAKNELKAGALNLGLSYLFGLRGPQRPAVVLTLDDDVRIGPSTVKELVGPLLRNPALGAVCSRAAVANKGRNLLTRLQGLEYVGFNAIRTADKGFLQGPLVMHGMLTAFRARALRQAGPFAERHLIEDYEMTTRIKSLGWEVRTALLSDAWTEVPERFAELWRQRTRWSYGGIEVVLHAKPMAVFQDILGHAVFLSTLAVILLLTLLPAGGSMPRPVVVCVIALSVLQLAQTYALGLWLMRWYPERDLWDWVLRASLVPELVYTNLMTLVLIGSYVFLLFNVAARHLEKFGLIRLPKWGRYAFGMLGYTGGWGTRTQ